MSIAISLLSLLLYICYLSSVSICCFVQYPLCFPDIPMGPPDLRTLVTQQTDQVRRSTTLLHSPETHVDLISQITILTSQLEASFAHNVNLNTRLLTTLDILDTLQAELDAERRKNDKHMWMHLIQELQREKEEMREVVELLIKKGKLSVSLDCLRCSDTLPFEWFKLRDPRATLMGGRLLRFTCLPLRVS